MTKFLFIQHKNENIGVEYLSASLKENNYPVELLFFAYTTNDKIENETIREKINTFKPDIICFSPFTFQYPWSVSKTNFIKKEFPNLFILFGGVHVNSVPNAVMEDKCIDGIIIGEADKTIVEFAKNYEEGDISLTPSLWYRKEGKIVRNPMSFLEQDLDKLPFPDKDIFYNSPLSPRSRLFAYTALGSRGCPFACTYCSNNVFSRLYAGQKRLRYRSPENFVDELEQNKKKFKYKRIEFADDVLAIDVPRLRKLMELYKQKVDVPFACFFHPKLVSEEVVTLLKNGGCTWFKLGVQSANEEYRKKFLCRFETNESILEVSRLSRKYGLKFSFDHILHLPGETKEHLIEAVNFYNQCRPTIINFWDLMYLPATDIIKYGLEYKIISESDLPKINNGTHELSKLNEVPWNLNTGNKINYSAFMLLFILISITPSFFIKYLMKIKFYNISFQIPNIILIFFKVISKFRAEQGYLYLSSVIGEFFRGCEVLKRSVTKYQNLLFNSR